jgi:hypothetical protein
MRHEIQSAPKDGKVVLLEDEASGEHVLARWPAEANDWVGESGEPTQIAATHWHAMPPASWARRSGVAFSSNQAEQPKVGEPFRWAVNARPADAIEAWAMSVEDRPVPKVQRRVAAPLTIATVLVTALVGASLGIFGGPPQGTSAAVAGRGPAASSFLEQAIVPQPRIDADGTHLPATAQTTGPATQSLEKAQRPETLADELANSQRTIRELHLQLRELASELAIARRETEMHAAQSRKTADEKAQLKQAADTNTALARELASQLAKVPRDVEAHATVTGKPNEQMPNVQQAPESTMAELRQSLQQERAEAEALVQDLATARREIETHATLARDANDEASRLKQNAESITVELRQSLRLERDKAEALTQDLATARREIDAYAKRWSEAVDETAQIKQGAADLRQSLQQERTRTEALARELELVRHATEQRNALEPAMIGQETQAATTTQAVAAEQPVTAEPQNSPDVARLLARGSALLSQGNIGAARTVLEYAAGAGSARASFALAETYDPLILSRWGTHGTRGDPAKARDLYATAYVGGIEEAKDRLSALQQ